MKKYIPEKIKPYLINSLNRVQSIGKSKIFGIGKNKTGTTSLKVAMKELGFVVGHQRTAENLLFDWAKRDFKSLVRYCKTAEFFQDFPFSRPYTFIILDHEFPKSKFILTVRDNPEQWYESVISFQAKLWGKNGELPTKEDLQQATYIYKGRPWDSKVLSGLESEDDLYNKDRMINAYINYNETVKDYFRNRPGDLLLLNVAEKGAYKKLCDYLNVQAEREEFPWENRTKEIKNS